MLEMQTVLGGASYGKFPLEVVTILRPEALAGVSGKRHVADFAE